MLDAALAISAAHGVRAVTMEAVAERLKVTKPVVYACFGSREELVGALLDREEARLFQAVLGALPVLPDFTDPEATFAQGFEALLIVAADNVSAWKLVFAAEPDPAVARRYGQARRRVAERVADLMRVRLGRAGIEDVERKLPFLVELFMSAGDAAVRTMVADAESTKSWTAKELGAFVGRVVLAGLRSA